MPKNELELTDDDFRAVFSKAQDLYQKSERYVSGVGYTGIPIENAMKDDVGRAIAIVAQRKVVEKIDEEFLSLKPGLRRLNWWLELRKAVGIE